MEYYDIYDGDIFVCRCWYFGMTQKIYKIDYNITVKRGRQ